MMFDAGNPWDFGTGFTQPPTFMPGAATMPVMPQVDLAEQFAAGMASRGIRPQQFFADPSVALPPQPAASPNVWDPTPVDTPGGNPVSMPGQPSSQMPLSPAATDASATGTEGEAAAGKQKSFGDKLQEGLRGVKAPTPPAAQTVRSPGAPEPKGQIKTGELLSLLLAMQPAGAQAGLKLPPTLGASLQGAYR